MSIRSLLRLSKCNLNARFGIFYRFMATDTTTNSNTASKPRYEANFGADCRAPHDKRGCEDAYFIWDDGNGIVAFGRLIEVFYLSCLQIYENFRITF